MAVELVERASAPVAARPHISHTQVSMFDECSLRWWLSYVLKIRKPQSIQMMVGGSIHNVLEENFRQKAITGVDLSADELLDKFVSAFDLRILEGSCDIPPNKEPGTFKDAGVAILQRYLETTAIPIQPRLIKLAGMKEPMPAVELELRRPIKGTDFDFLGYIDQWTVDNVIVDYKIVAKRWGTADIESKGRQGTAYAYLIDSIYPELIDNGLVSDFHICVRSAERPQVQVVSIKQDRAMVEGYARRLVTVVDQMKLVGAGKVEPQCKSGYCSDKLCQHYWECRDWQYGRLEYDEIPKSVWTVREDNNEEAE